MNYTAPGYQPNGPETDTLFSKKGERLFLWQVYDWNTPAWLVWSTSADHACQFIVASRAGGVSRLRVHAELAESSDSAHSAS